MLQKCGYIHDAPTTPESLGDESTLYVQVCWDLLMKYRQRAEKFYAAMPSVSKFRSLVRLDLEERAQWTHRFGTQVVPNVDGAVIKEVMTEREAIWVVSQHQLAPPEPKSAPSSGSNSCRSTWPAYCGRASWRQWIWRTVRPFFWPKWEGGGWHQDIIRRWGTVLCKAFQTGRWKAPGHSMLVSIAVVTCWKQDVCVAAFSTVAIAATTSRC